MNCLRKTKVVAQAGTSIFPLESSEHIPRIHGCHHPKSSLALDLQHIRSPDQMAVAKPTVLVFTLVAENYPNACACFNGNPAKVSGHRQIEALSFGFYDADEIKVCMAFSMEIYI